MKRPSFQFYPGDWVASQKLRRCSPAARGAWIDILCVLHDCDEYGVARYPLRELCRAAGVDLKHARELVEKGVLKGSDTDPVRFTWAPTHAGMKGAVVLLVTSEAGPCWFCSRFVIDEHKRKVRGRETRFDSGENQPKGKPKSQPKPSPKGGIGDGEGDGPSSSSSSSSSTTPDTSSLAESPPPARAHVGAREGAAQAPTDEAWKAPQAASEAAGGAREHGGATPIQAPTSAGRACLLMRQAGCSATNPSHPDLIAAIAEGVTPEALADTVREAVALGKGRPFAWAIATARSRHADGARITKTNGTRHDRPGPVTTVIDNLRAKYGTDRFDLSGFSDDDPESVPA